MTTSIKFIDQISDALEKKMQKDLVAYESNHGIDVNYKQFSLVLIHDNNEVIGVLNAYTAFAEIYIDDIWIDTTYRGKGYGKKLIAALENNFKNKGFNNINLVTSQFQAPEFYKKCGFELEFIRKNSKNPKLTKFFFVKYFDDEVQTQGIVLKGEKQSVYKTYEKIADWFDAHRSRELFEKPYLDIAITHLTPSAKILDLGCGMGEPIAQYFIENGFKIIGIDGSPKMVNLAQSRFPESQFFVADIRNINLDEKFDCIIAWHSFFHLSQNDQRAMFKIFEKHIQPGGVLIFTSGPEAGEVWSNNGGENLYHASLDPAEYQQLLTTHHFELLINKIKDEECGGATVWVAKMISP